jgi:hypothetical protein
VKVENAIGVGLVLLGAVAFVYSWSFYLTKIAREPSAWRNRVTLSSLGLVSLTILLWIIREMLFPKADWASGAGVTYQVHWAETWERVALRILAVALVLALFGRPRLILPIVLGCLGSGLFWIFTTMP